MNGLIDIVAASNAILDHCRERAGERQRNRVALIQPKNGGRPAMGLLYVGAYLLDNEFEVRFFDFLDELFPPNVRYNERKWKQLESFDPDFIGFGVLSSYCTATQRMIRRVRETMPDKIVVCGGKHPTPKPGDLLRHGADYCVIGEGEITIVELLDSLNFDLPPAGVQGIAYLENGEEVRTAPRPFLPLDAIKRPAFELIDYQKYIDIRLHSIPGHFLRAGFIFASRGCPFSCNYCSQNIKGLYRERSIDDVIDEIRWQQDHYIIEAMVFLDDLFYFKENRVQEFCHKVIELDIDLKYYCHARIDIVSEETVALMKKAGFIMLAVGLESGSDRILFLMNKKTTARKIEEAFTIYNRVGMDIFAHTIVGHPDETAEDLELTRALIQKIRPTMVPVNYYMPMPGTKSSLFDRKEAKYLLDPKADEFTYTHDYPEFSNNLPLEELKRIGDELEAMAKVNRNRNLFTYPAFWLFLAGFVLRHPLTILEALYIRYISHRTRQMSFFSVLKDTLHHRTLHFN